MRAPNQRGIALVIVLVVISLLAITTVEFAFSAQVYTHMARNSLNGLQANLLARSGVNLGEAVLAFDEDPQVDAFTEEWCPEPTEVSCRIEGTLFGLPDNMRLRIEIFDENGKVNLNLTKPNNINEYNAKREDPTRFLLFDMWRAVFERLLESQGISPDAAIRLYDYWDQTIDAALGQSGPVGGGPGAADPNDEEGQEPPPSADIEGQPAGAEVFARIDFPTLDDANAILQLSARELRELRRVVTAAPGALRVNANTAPREVLTSLIDDPGIVEDIMARRLDAPIPTNELAAMIPPVSLGDGVPDPRRMLHGRSDTYRIWASAIVNANPMTGRGGIGRSAALLVRRAQSRTRPPTGSMPIAWTFTRLDWQKEGGAFLFEERRDADSGPSRFVEDSRFF